MSSPSLRSSLACVKCGYDLEGLPVDAKCPECGQDIMATLAVRLDPATEALERSGTLLRTAWGVYLSSAGSVAACAVGAAPIIDAVRARLPVPVWLVPVWAHGWVGSGIDGARAVLPAVALLGALVGFAGSVFVLPWRRERPIVRARLAGGAGFLIWGAAAAQPASFASALLALAGTAAVVASVTPVLRQLVPHARLFRTARHATQSTRDLLISTAVTAGAGALALALGDRRGEAADYAVFAGAVSLASAMLLFVGLCYRMANAFWILRSVRTPPPRLDDVLGDMGGHGPDDGTRR
jgi:hypothetical protein